MDNISDDLFKCDGGNWIRFGECPVCGMVLMANTHSVFPLAPFHNKSGGPGVCIGTSDQLKNVRFEDTNRFHKKNE